MPSHLRYSLLLGEIDAWCARTGSPGVALLLIGLGLTQLNNPGSGGNLLAVSALLGLGFALPPRCTTTMLINYFGRTAFSRLMGIAMFCMSMGPAVTAVSAGVAFDRFGSYSYVIYFFATACLILACTMPFISPTVCLLMPSHTTLRAVRSSRKPVSAVPESSL